MVLIIYSNEFWDLFAFSACLCISFQCIYVTWHCLQDILVYNYSEFEDLAVGVLNSCYMHDEQKAQDLLIREMNNWGRATCVLIAVQADNKRFISQTACQSLLNSIWMGKMSQDNGLIRVSHSECVLDGAFELQ